MLAMGSQFVTFQAKHDSGSACCGGGNGGKSSCCGGSKPERASGGCCGGAQGATQGGCCSSKEGQPDYLLWIGLVMLMAGFVVAGIPEAPEWALRYGETCVELFIKSWWGILLGIIAVAVIGRVPREVVAALLGRPGSVSGLFRAVLAGVFLDLCNHGILLVGMGLYRRGASLGQTLAFLVASPWNSFSLTVILAALIGWKWMAIFIVGSIVVAMLTGWIVDRLVLMGKLPQNENRVDLPQGYRPWPEVRKVFGGLLPGRCNYRELLVEGASGSVMVLRWLFFGFVLTALIRAFMQELTFEHYFGPTVLGMVLTLIATTIIEVCSEGSSPIAADLLLRAHAPGNAFLFLMTGAATDYTEVVSLRETTGSWKIAFALPLVSTPQVLLLAWVMNHYS